MTAINSVEVQVTTGNDAHAGTDENVYVGIGNHEFQLNSSANDFERGSTRTYVLGKGANISAAGDNDPRHLTLEQIEAAPVYLRVGERTAAAQQQTTAGHGGIGDMFSRAANAASHVGAEINQALMHDAGAASRAVQSTDWHLQSASVTVHAATGVAIDYQTPAADTTTVLGGHNPGQITLNRV